MPTTDEFVRLVKRMRGKQKLFFSGDRSAGTVRHAKDLERRVDRAVGELLGDRQPGLFDGGGD